MVYLKVHTCMKILVKFPYISWAFGLFEGGQSSSPFWHYLYFFKKYLHYRVFVLISVLNSVSKVLFSNWDQNKNIAVDKFFEKIEIVPKWAWTLTPQETVQILMKQVQTLPAFSYRYGLSNKPPLSLIKIRPYRHTLLALKWQVFKVEAFIFYSFYVVK